MTDTQNRPWNFTQQERSKQRREKARRLFAAGWTVMEIANELQLTRQMIFIYLKKGDA